MTLGSTLSDLWHRFQGDLFPALAEAVGPLLEAHKRFVTALDLVKVDPTLRRLCGWSRVSEIPREATFSRAFAEFSQSRLPERMHAALVAETLGDALIGHVSRASTPKARTPNRKRGRPRKGAERTKEPGRLERQANGMDLDERLDALPKVCDHGAQKTAKGSWRPGAVTSCLSTQQTAGCR